ncbi:hypothetical protein AAG906_035576 [Vitis piasezkii]
MIVGDEGYPLYKEKDGKEKLKGNGLSFKGSIYSVQTGVRTYPPMVLLAMVREINQSAFFSIASLSSFIFWFVIMPLGGGKAIITLWAAERSWEAPAEIVGSDLPSFHSCLFTLRWRNVGHGSVVMTVEGCGVGLLFLTVDLLSCRFHSSPRLKNVYEQGSDLIWLVRRCSCREICGQVEREGVPRTVLHPQRPRYLFYQGAVQCWAPVPPAVVVQGVSALHPDSSGLYPSQYGPGADGVQHSGYACSTWTSHCWSLPDSTKGAAKGHVLVKGLWAGLAVHPDRQFAPNQSLKVLGITELLPPDKRGKLVEWVEKVSLDRLNRLFDIARPKPQSYVLNILPRRLPKEVVAGEHFVLQDLPFYAAVRKADARSRKARLNNREVKRQEGLSRLLKKKVSNKGKEVKLPTSPKEFVIPPSTYVKEITIRESDHPVPPSISSGSGRNFNKSARSPHPDADVAGASCAATLPPSAPPTEETGAESQSLPPCELNALALVPVKGPATRRSRPCDLKSASSGGFRIARNH